jgi:hypothetical protein
MFISLISGTIEFDEFGTPPVLIAFLAIISFSELFTGHGTQHHHGE